MLESEEQEHNEKPEPSTQKAKQSDSAKNPPKKKLVEQLLSFSPLVMISFMCGLLLIAWMITSAIEKMRSTVKSPDDKSSELSDNRPSELPATLNTLDNNNYNTNSNNFNRLPPLRD
ncbi:MAG: hypothetical protein VSS52_006555, partial [Thiotrichaceae bacterium]|nr:hypothetical protein [Thiotrichaceae bacterium]